MTAQLADSPVSAFYYADKLFTPLTTTLIYSISTVLFPKFSEEYASAGRDAYLRYIWNVLRSTLLLILPIALAALRICPLDWLWASATILVVGAWAFVIHRRPGRRLRAQAPIPPPHTAARPWAPTTCRNCT